MDIVLGSGPAAVACTRELLRAGRKVLMVDPGRSLPPASQELAADFRNNPEPRSYLEKLRGMRAALPKGMRDKKLPFSSPHVYEGIDRFLPLRADNAHIARSLASGGLSAIWGATVMPMTARSFRNWPVTQDDMAPFYRRAAEIIDIPNPHDDLETLYPHYGDAPPLALSPHGAQLMAALLNNKQALNDAGILFGRCRSAVGKRYANNGEGCVYCGFCMYGCPYKTIFNADYVLDDLKTNPDFSCKTGWIAERFTETTDGVSVYLRHQENGRTETITSERLFVACGAATSLRLVADACRWYDRRFTLLDTQRVSIPLLLKRSTGEGLIPRTNTLGQVFIEIDDPEICYELIHVQIYGYNPFIFDMLAAKLGRLPLPEKLLQPLFSRLMFAMTYLPSQISGSISVAIKPPEDGKGMPTASYTGVENPRTVAAVAKLKNKLWRQRQNLGLIPVLPGTEIAQPGVSVHLAGGLPMRRNPGPGESDILGRPFGMQNVHVVDGACFSDLPGEHLTYTIMANAARIGAQSTERLKR